MRTLLIFALSAGVAAIAGAQSPPTLGVAAVRDVLAHYTVNPLVLVPASEQSLPADGKWSISVARPDSCPKDATPCARVLYPLPELQFACEWTVEPSAGEMPARFLHENDNAARYFLRKMTSAELGGLVMATPQPAYPAIARAAHVAGTVAMRVVVSSAGVVSSATIVSGPEMLRVNALDAAKRWTFRPLQVGTQAIPFLVESDATFRYSPSATLGTLSMRP